MIYKEVNGRFWDIPVWAIEIKGFNPNKAEILKDLERNLEYFSMSSETGNSHISFTLFAALHSYKKTMFEEKAKENELRVKKRYEKYLYCMNLPQNVRCEIEVFTIRRGHVDDLYVAEMGLQGDEDYHFLGAIITFYSFSLENDKNRLCVRRDNQDRVQ